MTTLESILTLTLLILVPAVVWLAVDTWALRRDIGRLDLEDDYIESRISLTIDTGLEHAGRLWDHHLRIAALEDDRDTTSDLDVPDPDAPTTPTYRPVPAHFHEWR